MADRKEGEVRLLALRNAPREYSIFGGEKEEMITEAVQFLREAGGGVLYKFEYTEDKNGDVIPKCERLGVV